MPTITRLHLCTLKHCFPSVAGILFAVPLLVAIASAQDAENGVWTPELSMEFRRLQGTAMSPDGRHVAYVVSTPLMQGEKSEFQTHIWVAAADESSNRQYTRGDFSAADPQFSPDGEYISFASKRGEGEDAKTQVWVIPLFGGEARQVTDAPENVSSHKWSPEGERIAFTMQEPLGEERRKANKEKRDVILVDQEPRYQNIYVVSANSDADDLQVPMQLTAGNMNVGSFDWSPSGNEIVFDHKPTVNLDDGNIFGDISIVTVPGADELASLKAELPGPDEEKQIPQIDADLKTLVAGDGVEAHPFWSPDGRWIAYTSSGNAPNLVGLSDVYVMPSGGGDARRLAQTPNRSPGIIGWSGYSDELYLVEALGTRRAVLALPLRGDEIRSLTPDTGVVGDVSFAGDATDFAYSWQTSDQPWDLYTHSTDTRADAKRVTELHAGITIPEMGRTELLTWASEDGMEIEGFLTYPIGYIEGRTYPIVLNVHGGPAGVFSDSFTGGPGQYVIQYFAQNGFAVLRPNPRGSTGYGYEFREATATQWGDGDLQDLLSGLDAVIDMGIGDADEQYLMGWSYGGYITAWTVTQTERFKAASMGAGITNLVSMSMTSDLRRYLVTHMGDYYWDDMEAYRRASPMHHIANVVTPTQILHGQEDVRVPTSQGEEFYHALKYRGIDTEMIVYPRTPHGPREPKFMMDISARILDWFNQYRAH
jgi:dipeptidyl aminopeptidase/acylaminoacyl peptidase